MLADICSRLGKDDEAEKLYREALALGLVAFREPHSMLDRPSRRTGRLPGKARPAPARRSRCVRRRCATPLALYGENHALTARAFTGMGDHFVAAGAFEEAERLYRRAVTVRQNIHPAPHWRIAEARSRVGYALFRQQRYEEAEALLTESYTRLKHRHRRDPRGGRSRARLAHRTLRRLESPARRRPLSRRATSRGSISAQARQSARAAVAEPRSLRRLFGAQRAERLDA